MVLNRQLECGFSKGSPSLINTFVLSPRWAASWNACNCHWLEKMFICFFKRQNWKIAFYQHFRTLNASPPPRMKLFGNQQLECLQGHIFFQAETHIYIYISQTLQVTIKKVVYHIIFIVLAFFCGYLEVLGIWMYLFENITLFFVHFAGLGKDSMKSFNEPAGSPKALLLAFPIR